MSNLLLNELFAIEAEIVELPRPDTMQYAKHIPIKTYDASRQWEDTFNMIAITGYTGDVREITDRADDLPLSDFKMDKGTTSVKMFGFAYEWTEKELGQASLRGFDVLEHKIKAALYNADKAVNRIAFSGASNPVGSNFSGISNQAGVNIMGAPVGASGVSTWVDATGTVTKTGTEMLADLNALVSKPFSMTFGVEDVDTILMDNVRYNAAATTYIDINSSVSVLQAFTRVRQELNRPVSINPIFGLEKAGVGDLPRMAAYRNDVKALRLHMVMEPNFVEEMRRGPIHWQRPGIMRLGGVEALLPASMQYMDGI
jgi:hypothetical protein